jgi:hypothetical protein
MSANSGRTSRAMDMSKIETVITALVHGLDFKLYFSTGILYKIGNRLDRIRESLLDDPATSKSGPEHHEEI